MLGEQLILNGSVASSALGVSNRLEMAVQVYAQYHRIEGSTAATLRFYRTELGAFVKAMELAGKVMTAEVTRFDIMAHLEAIRETRAPRSIKTRLTALSAFFGWAQEWDIIEVNPTAKLKPPRVAKVRKDFLSQAQFQSILDICLLDTFLGARRQSMFQLFLTTGMRRRELSLLNLADLNWAGMSIRVIHGKGQKERNVPFVNEAQRVVIKYLQHRSDAEAGLGVTESAQPLCYWSLGQDMQRMMERAGVQVKDVCHIFRRTWAAGAVRQGIPRPWVQGVAGWSTPTMMDHYVEAMQGESEAIEAFKDFSPWG